MSVSSFLLKAVFFSTKYLFLLFLCILCSSCSADKSKKIYPQYMGISSYTGENSAIVNVPSPSPSIKPLQVNIAPSPAKPENFGSIVTSTLQEQAINSNAKHIDLVFCLDTSGSMGFLIDSAMHRLREIAENTKNLKQKPTLRIALISYGSPQYGFDKGWVRIETDFTKDLNVLYEKLSAIKCSGGTEYVARSIQSALTELSWINEKDTLKTIFIAGNENTTQDPKISIPDICSEAIKKGVIINTIFCGYERDMIAGNWKELAELGKGKFSILSPSMLPAVIPSNIPISIQSIFPLNIQRNISQSIKKPIHILPTQSSKNTCDGRIVGIFNNSSIILEGSGISSSKNKIFRIGNKTVYSPASWHPQSGDRVRIHFKPEEPDFALKIESVSR